MPHLLFRGGSSLLLRFLGSSSLFLRFLGSGSLFLRFLGSGSLLLCFFGGSSSIRSLQFKNMFQLGNNAHFATVHLLGHLHSSQRLLAA